MPNKKGDFSKRIVVFVVILNILFTMAVLFIFYTKGNEPIALIGAWFAFTTSELVLLASVKKTKIKEGENSDEDKLETKVD